ncbi:MULTISPECIES: hypothetical protein [unclassified Streptomyces]|uniref:hypothetical protein n=1 Tax=unclassified Streptomyces TaxID=2593676 RepID=UPI00081DAF6A|nr:MULTISPECIES: hypothetical protein [unclassified Streptomyces]MYZ35850.1 hypothetical protein [Streptomyces sp. SID4917]SCF78837.1 hypothetical protein GA0115259_102555 [Streptomyces sp. MnatMP-M17]
MNPETINKAGEQPTEDSPGLVTRTADSLRSGLTGEAATALAAGSRILVRKGWNQVAPESPIWQRLGYVGAGGYLLVSAAAHADLGAAAPFVLPGTAVVWCVAAWIVSPPPGPKRAPRRSEGHEPEESAGRDLATVAALIRTVAAEHNHQGAHLADLIATGLLDPWQQPELKAALTSEWGIPVAEIKLRFRGRQRVRDGVRLRDLPELPDEAAREAAADTPPESAASPSPRPLPSPAQGPG